MSEKEVRTFLGEVRVARDEDTNKMTLEGAPIVFNQSTDIGGWWEEVIEPGAIKEDALKDVRLLVNHDTNGIPLARSRNNNANSTMRLTIMDSEVHMTADLDAKNPKAVELWSASERQDIDGMSFMFIVDGDRWENLESDYPKRYITSISKVFEVSAVTFPAYEQTYLNARSLESGKASLESAREALESAKKRSQRIAELNARLEKEKS